MISYLLFILGFILLIKGADLFVDGASSIAKRLKISNLVIGLTVVAFGTSAPELVINIFASFEGKPDIAIGNILGSNIANVFLILGVAALIHPLVVHQNTIWKEIPLCLLATIVIAFMANDALIDKAPYSMITRIDGLILISFFIIFLYYTVTIAKVAAVDTITEIKQISLWQSILFIILGLIGLVIGGDWIVQGAIKIASLLNISQSLIGLTVVAIGTSLPELATSAVAAYKKQSDIAVGNVVGSNIFNIFWILGLSSTISPLPFKITNNIDIAVTILANLLLFCFLFIGKKHHLKRWQGLLFIIIYSLYLSFLFYKG